MRRQSRICCAAPACRKASAIGDGKKEKATTDRLNLFPRIIRSLPRSSRLAAVRYRSMRWRSRKVTIAKRRNFFRGSRRNFSDVVVKLLLGTAKLHGGRRRHCRFQLLRNSRGWGCHGELSPVSAGPGGARRGELRLASRVLLHHVP